jgi:cytochrome c556
MRLLFGTAAAAVLLSLGLSATPVAAQSAMQAIDARKALMKSNGGAARVIGQYVRAGKGTSADVANSARTIIANAERIPSLFPEGSTSSDSHAKPEIWMHFDEFKGYAARLKSEGEKLLAAAEANDKAGIGQAMASMGRNACGACHNDFRLPMKR